MDIGFERTSAWFLSIKTVFFILYLLGNHITKDISKILKLNKEYSEDLKTKFNLDENESFYNKILLKKLMKKIFLLIY